MAFLFILYSHFILDMEYDNDYDKSEEVSLFTNAQNKTWNEYTLKRVKVAYMHLPQIAR